MIIWLGISLMLLTFIVIAIDTLFIPTAILSILSITAYLLFLFYVYVEVSVTMALILAMTFITAGGTGFYLILKYKWWQILSNQHPLSKDETFHEGLEKLIGAEAVTLSELRPSGKIDVNNRRYDAIAQSALFIKKDVRVKITSISSTQLVVKPL